MSTFETGLREHIHDLRVYPAETFQFPLGMERESLRDCVFTDGPLSEKKQQELIGYTLSKDHVVVEIATELLLEKADSNILGDNIAILSVLAQDGDVIGRICAAQLFTRMGDTALPFIDQLLNDQEDEVRYQAIQALTNKSFHEAFPRVQNIWESDFGSDKVQKSNFRRIAIRTIGQYDDVQVDEFLAQAKLIEDEDYLPSFVQSVIDQRNERRERANQVVASEGTTYNPISLVDYRSRLLWKQKSFLASLDTSETIHALNQFGALTNKFRERYKDDFIGVVLFGSLGEGYRLPDSDFDFVVLIKSGSISAGEIRQFVYEHFPDELERDRSPTVIFIDAKTKTADAPDLEYLFQGVYIGDTSYLHTIQLHSLLAIDEETWESKRKKLDWMLAERPVSRLIARHDFQGVNPRRIENARRLLHVPPDYKTMLHLLEKGSVPQKSGMERTYIGDVQPPELQHSKTNALALEFELRPPHPWTFKAVSQLLEHGIPFVKSIEEDAALYLVTTGKLEINTAAFSVVYASVFRDRAFGPYTIVLSPDISLGEKYIGFCVDWRTTYFTDQVRAEYIRRNNQKAISFEQSDAVIREIENELIQKYTLTPEEFREFYAYCIASIHDTSRDDNFDYTHEQYEKQRFIMFEIGLPGILLSDVTHMHLKLDWAEYSEEKLAHIMHIAGEAHIPFDQIKGYHGLRGGERRITDELLQKSAVPNIFHEALLSVS
jgi:predicted nucleotidyltransferase